MRIHREGTKILIITALIVTGVTLGISRLLPEFYLYIYVLGAIFFLFVLYFFRDPVRMIKLPDNNIIYAPADGKIVAIEEVMENEYFNDRRIQVSIFMSPINVHVNRNPISGKVNYFKYHPGKYLVAWHPKSSQLNERTTVVIDNGKQEILLRQIAGFLAKRIVNYLNVGDEVKQGRDMGFIKFGSRVDLFLPLNAHIEVSLNEKVKGNVSVIARF